MTLERLAFALNPPFVRRTVMLMALCALIPISLAAQTGSISGMKFNDANDSHGKDLGEVGIPSWTIDLYRDSLIVDSVFEVSVGQTQTDLNGNYLFGSLIDGEYTVREAVESGWRQTFPPSGSHSATITGGNSVTGLDFGNTDLPAPGSISGIKFNDIDADGIRDTSEPGIQGWTIEIYEDTVTPNPNPLLSSTQTGPIGQYSFTDLPPGPYTVREVLELGWTQTLPPSPGIYKIVLGPGQNAGGFNFGNVGTNSIAGRKFDDIDGDCFQDPGEIGLPGWVIRLDPGPRYAVTNANGDYSFTSLGAGTYTISEVVKNRWEQTCPTVPGTHVVVVTSGETITGKSFGNRVVDPIQDLSVSLWAVFPGNLRSPCCGQQMTHVIHYSNEGTNTVTGATVELDLSALLSYQSSTASPALAAPLQSSNVLTWTLPTPLPPGSSGMIYVTTLLNGCSLPAAPLVTSVAEINPVAGDGAPANNSSTYSREATCSFDPNDKAVVPAGCGSQGLITAVDSLTYTIRFQNLGTGPAVDVIVRDTLDPALDVATLANMTSSHSYFLDVDGNRLTWTFPSINLPPASSDEPGSIGFIQFRVLQLPGNPNGTVIGNTASIYFDLNPPVVTNTTINTITDVFPVASFTITPDCTPSGCEYDFTYTGGTPLATYAWNFGPGAVPPTSTLQNPADVVYSTPGTKLVTLVVSLGDCASDPATDTIHAEINLTYRTFTAAQLADNGQRKPVRRVGRNRPILLPTTGNVVQEALAAFSTIRVGLPGQFLDISSKEKGYVFPTRQHQVFRTFNFRGITHYGAPGPLDFYNGDVRRILRRQRSIPVTRHNNTLLADLLALQVNLAASSVGTTPGGLGSLIYTDPGQPFDEMTIDDIADSMNVLMTNWESVNPSFWVEADSVIAAINASCSTPMPNGRFTGADTLQWNRTRYMPTSPLLLNGVRTAAGTGILRENPGAAPESRHGDPAAFNERPGDFKLEQNYPNPFNPVTTIEFTLPAEAFVTLTIYNVLGQEVSVLLESELMDEGTDEVEFDASRLPSGVYFYRLVAQGAGDADEGGTGERFVSMKKMLFMK